MSATSTGYKLKPIWAGKEKLSFKTHAILVIVKNWSVIFAVVYLDLSAICVILL